MDEKQYFSRISSKGQITLTKPVRDKLSLNSGDYVIIEIRDNNEIVLKKAVIKAESDI